MQQEQIFNYKNIQAFIRENTSDSFIIREVMSGAYNKLNINPSDIIIDFGLNIGIFTIYALLRGARHVYSYEPERENFNLAVKNIKLNNLESKCTLINSAVVGNNDITRVLSYNIKRNKAAHSLVIKRGRTSQVVSCININTILKDINPSVIKMDIEGGEYECIPAIDNFYNIREFILEFHHAHLNDIKTHKKYNEILNILRSNFESVTAKADTKGAWVNTVYCKNTI